jgi:hypothetical protein
MLCVRLEYVVTNNKIVNIKSSRVNFAVVLKLCITPRRQPQCGVYLLFLFFSCIVYRFIECQPPKTARIARLLARWQQFYLSPFAFLINSIENEFTLS